MKKIYPSAAAALAGIVKSGQLMAVGGFGLCGIPEALIAALRDDPGARRQTLRLCSTDACLPGARSQPGRRLTAIRHADRCRHALPLAL